VTFSVDIDIGRGGKFKPHQWNLKNLKSCVKEWQTFMYENAGWNAIFSENHDQSRTVSRFTSDLPQHRCYAAKMLATWLGFQSGTIYIYQGQELGMKNMPADWGIEEYKDIETQNFWAE
jgi:glycosidase